MVTADEVERFERERRDADRRYNDALTALDRAIVSSAARDPLTRDDRERIGTALMLFLQQITAFVESKDRELASQTASQLADLARTVDPIQELRTQMSVVQRAV